jgi:hypothetical protein
MYFSDPADYMQKTINCKWKTQDAVIPEILDKIFNNFPGGTHAAAELAIEDKAKIEAAPDYTLADFDKLAKKWNDKYAITINKKKNYILIPPDELASADQEFKENCLNMFKTLEYSKLAKMLCNVVYFFAKIRYQAKSNTFNLKLYLTAQGKNTSDDKKIVFGQFINAIANDSKKAGEAIRDEKRQQATISNLNYLNMTDDEQHRVRWDLNSRLIAWPACFMANNLSQLDLRIAQGDDSAI